MAIITKNDHYLPWIHGHVSHEPGLDDPQTAPRQLLTQIWYHRHRTWVTICLQVCCLRNWVKKVLDMDCTFFDQLTKWTCALIIYIMLLIRRFFFITVLRRKQAWLNLSKMIGIFKLLQANCNNKTMCYNTFAKLYDKEQPDHWLLHSLLCNIFAKLYDKEQPNWLQ